MPGSRLIGSGASRAAASAPMTEKPRELGEQPVRPEADGDGDADLALHPSREAGEHYRRRGAMQRLRARQVERRFIDGERFDERREVAHQCPDAPGFGGVFGHVRLDDDGFRAELRRLEHGHGGADAREARDIAGGGDDAPLAAADDEGLGGKLRPVAFLDAGVEGVALDMGDGEGEEFRVADREARSAAGAETGGTLADRIAGSAQARHRGSTYGWGEPTGVQGRS
jgi:hypothetical protein